MPKDKEEKKEEVEMEKATMVAFCSLKGLHVTPFVKPNGRVAFRVKGNVSEVLAELQNNPLINVLAFIQRLDIVRGFIFTLKGESSNGK
ncbi:MAG: hypothetical protein ACXACY_16260 [Candidatus Hodarchaeales archaeon]|jgi:hypothetical protein